VIIGVSCRLEEYPGQKEENFYLGSQTNFGKLLFSACSLPFEIISSVSLHDFL
jgi:hypothetical protein